MKESRPNRIAPENWKDTTKSTTRTSFWPILRTTVHDHPALAELYSLALLYALLEDGTLKAVVIFTGRVTCGSTELTKDRIVLSCHHEQRRGEGRSKMLVGICP